MSLSRNKKLFLLGVLIALVVAIPFTIFIAQEQQETKSKAEAATTLSFTPTSSPSTPLMYEVSETIPLTISLNPQTNFVSLVSLEILYDETKFEPSGVNAFVPNTAVFPRIIEGPIYTSGKIQISLSIGADPTQAVRTISHVGTVTFKALANTRSPSTVTLGPNTKIFSVAVNDQATENVLSSRSPAYIQVGPPPSTQNVTN